MLIVNAALFDERTKGVRVKEKLILKLNIYGRKVIQLIKRHKISGYQATAGKSAEIVNSLDCQNTYTANAKTLNKGITKNFAVNRLLEEVYFYDLIHHTSE